MTSQATRFWTFNSLVGAFLDLFIAHFLLCGSAIALFAVEFLGLFGLSLPTPDNGLFGIPNSDFKNVLVGYPTDKISAVQFSVTRKFPFDSIFFSIQNCNANHGLNLDRVNRFRELEGEASCSSKSDARKVVRNETDDSGIRIQKEKGFDMKGKGAVNYRVRCGFRRRRKGSFDHGKHSSVSSSPNWITCVDQPSNDKDHSQGFEDEAETPMVVKSDGNYHQHMLYNDPGNLNEAQERIVLLTRELEEEQGARAALYVELEKERNAAATAADEAMAMILRLQEEKASIEMESRQYHRMVEEKSAYDEEEMNILKEIVLRREREKHFLEKEIEAYQQTIRFEHDQIYGDKIHDFTEDPDRISHNLISKEEDTNTELPEKTIKIVEEEQRSKLKEMRVFDVHVIDNEPNSNGNEKEKSFIRKLEEETDDCRSVSGKTVGLPPVSLKSLRRNSTSALDNERTKLGTEVEWLRERLKVVQGEREKLNFSIDSCEKGTLQLQILEDIARQLQEIGMLTDSRKARQASLPLPSSKSLRKKRRCRSVSSGPAKSS